MPLHKATVNDIDDIKDKPCRLPLIRFVLRWSPTLDCLDPAIIWNKVRILQYLTTDGKWVDVPMVDECHLQEPLPRDQAERDLYFELKRKER